MTAPALDEPIDQVAADEARAPDDERPHGASFSTDVAHAGRRQRRQTTTAVECSSSVNVNVMKPGDRAGTGP